ncbi:MAG: hypothetical protein LIP02_09180 [Bacteroidales bacterium]|nr:hypothetical protein [Bacteroidales bacterium]
MKDYTSQEFRKEIRSATVTETLRQCVREVESAIFDIVGPNPMSFYSDYPSKEHVEKIDELLSTRRILLDRMFRYTDEEVQALERVNELLKTLRRQMYERTTSLYRTVLCNPDADFDDDYNVEGTLNSGVEYDPEDGDFGTVIHYDSDHYYGSAFSPMLYILRENDEACRGCMSKIDECSIGHRSTHTPDITDEQLHCDWRNLDDGHTWIEWHAHPRLDHINVCYGLHCMFDHHHYSLADIIRVDDFVVEAHITCQRLTDQRGRRYRDRFNEENADS